MPDPTPEPQLDEFDLTIDATTPEDVTIPISVRLQYPRGMGAYAADVLPYLAEQREPILMQLLQRLDTSTVERARLAGILDDNH